MIGAEGRGKKRRQKRIGKRRWSKGRNQKSESIAEALVNHARPADVA